MGTILCPALLEELLLLLEELLGLEEPGRLAPLELPTSAVMTPSAAGAVGLVGLLLAAAGSALSAQLLISSLDWCLDWISR